jgi:hypothetical protein
MMAIMVIVVRMVIIVILVFVVISNKFMKFMKGLMFYIKQSRLNEIFLRLAKTVL